MRYHDQPTIEVEMKVAATPEEVWPVVTDITLPVDLPGELYEAEWLADADGPAVGARFVGRNRIDNLGQTETVCTVVELEPGRRWVYSVNVGDMEPWAQWGFEVDPSRDGSVVRQFVRIGLAPSPLKVAIDAAPEKEGRIISRRLGGFRDAITANLEEVRRRCEA
ncbi:MAG TPA: SRPBCC family protein [Gordonia sp. (in: high G+C Gram-positive bacteria)]|uniref:SRPBCC family protein n=1 Tax=unclassified Gordonia (in: high G+C Gram-positive bacteria) TaxID=2657482 RepID=UPI000FB5C6BD|nr:MULTISPECIES: SRPBCC family protein [unclassified Gordonia (in: high G+C Gram-positive bacteria)]RUP35499.1 MAG: SRPBCC family protein [Gordonia sp. (in: high G+C Gram-positive bacteria)]HNP57671.1 SRPBCC family protein [Gordonia sp. (in: high G+C Gram-positive bacteria)]HRC50684.1 SRPBCC family protein [Gordonia sp. (in: high G+C Gram-positive bacteria)]